MDPAPLQVFLAYARKDARHRDELMAHLSGLIEKGILEVWYDERIPPGAHWRDEILEHLKQARMVLLLVSPWFRNSSSCREEVGLAMELARSGKARVIPILVGQVEYETAPYAHLQFLPGNGSVPSLDGDARNAAFAEIAARLRDFSTELRDALPEGEGSGATGIPGRLNGIAVRLADQGLPRDALGILEEAIGIYGDGETEDFAVLLSNRGLVRQDLGDFEGARQDLELAWKISAEILGPDDPVVARRLAHLGGALLELGEEERARQLLERALAILELTATPRNPDLLLACLHLGDALKSEPRRARELLERILDEGAKEQEPRAAAAAHSTLGRIAFREGRYRDAGSRFRQAVEIGEKSFRRGHPFVGIDLHNLGLTLRALGSLNKARGVLRRALDVLVPRLGAASPRVRQTEEALALAADAAVSAPE